RDRQRLVAQRRDLKLQIGALLREHRQRCRHARWTVAWRAWLEHQARLPEQARWVMQQRLRRLEWLTQEIRRVEHRPDPATSADATVGWLRAIRGIGPVTAWTLRAEVGRFDRLRRGKQPSRSCGLTPCNRSSGAARPTPA